ncbi:DeoR/GlpR family DNA-binding transcription regulator [Arthrobacter tumbae]|uniref:DeoR/GlpR family DNA-binding transcription regulator n=1 Tax=Arthrobacter tumbae TaxID=163874 RepID=UPI00195C6077|nr:DeoR/GlpR family DNA-binding transcription regulator [Arthrobacter tumbae]MBM7782465.1 DeoR/GlpR family transcriptional regulator of sugar metabolism [Arthrobacter tumbae]
MLAADRHAAILAKLGVQRTVRVSELAEALGVSDMTIRRDIDVLDAAGALRKVHGGAASRTALSALEPGFGANADQRPEAKESIAAAAAALIQPGMTVALTGGTTTYRLVDHLSGPLTILTNSLPAAEKLHRSAPPGVTVLLTGGERSPSEALVGPIAASTVRSFNVDLCFMGAHGVDAQAGITTPNLAEADTNRAFAEQCGRLVVLADSTKFGTVSLARIAGIERVHCIVTDSPPDDPRYARTTSILTPPTRTSSNPQDTP